MGEDEDLYEYCDNLNCSSSEYGECIGHITRTFLKECGVGCSCQIHCPNRVVQHGVTRKLQVNTPFVGFCKI